MKLQLTSVGMKGTSSSAASKYFCATDMTASAAAAAAAVESEEEEEEEGLGCETKLKTAGLLCFGVELDSSRATMARNTLSMARKVASTSALAPIPFTPPTVSMVNMCGRQRVGQNSSRSVSEVDASKIENNIKQTLFPKKQALLKAVLRSLSGGTHFTVFEQKPESCVHTQCIQLQGEIGGVSWTFLKLGPNHFCSKSSNFE